MTLHKRPSEVCKCGRHAEVCRECHAELERQFRDLVSRQNDLVREIHRLQRASPTNTFDAGTELGMKRAYAEIVGGDPLARRIRFACPYCGEWRIFDNEDRQAELFIRDGGSAYRECPGRHKMLALVGSAEQQRAEP
jgi:hypothetical protein